MWKSTQFLTVACLTALVASSALACGESLYRVGKGVAFRQYSAPLPGTIVVVADTEAERAMAGRLAAAGHDVHVVWDPSEIGAEIANAGHTFNLVVAMFSQRDIVEAQITSAHVAFLPVALEGTEATQAQQLYGGYLPDQGTVKHFLRTIHAVLRAQG